MASRIFVTHQLPEPIEKRMAELFGHVPRQSDSALDSAGIILRAKGANVLVPTLSDAITKDVIDALSPNLKLIANFGAGVDHIDVSYAKKRGIIVTNTPSVLTEDTADIAMTLILGVPRRLSEAAQAIRLQQWQGWSPLYMLGHRVNGKKLGIVGLGRIGQAVAKRAKGFGIEIHYHQRVRLHASVEKELGATYHATLDAMLKEVDIVSLHCPHTKDTHHLMNAARFKKMKPSAYIINTARGALIDETAMIDALKDGVIAGAGLDVYEHAPDVPHALRNQPNVILLPHISSATIESRLEMGERVIINIRSFLDGHNPPDKVLVEEAI
ncbi:MAG: D-glycerate dehydrogenase [Alphaproteobacteria bacterium]|nr:D-glycerate dehydrogenase [Alphaproteobacteria bacterium]